MGSVLDSDDDDVRVLATERMDLVTEKFGESFAAQFQKSPVAVFESLPEPTKRILGRMARDRQGMVRDGNG